MEIWLVKEMVWRNLLAVISVVCMLTEVLLARQQPQTIYAVSAAYQKKAMRF
jgi:hypothetical protein